MELRHLRYFLAIADELNFSRAAKRVHIEQSPFSRAIKELEHQLGVQLLERTSRSTHLTPAGHLFQRESQRLLEMLDQAQTKVRNIACGHLGTLRVGTADGLARAELTELMALYREEESGLELQLSHQPMNELISNLQCNRLDIGIALPLSPLLNYGLSAEQLWPDHLVGVLCATHPLAISRTITLSDMAKVSLILGKTDNWTSVYQLIAPLLGAGHSESRSIYYASGHESMILMAESGYGLGFALASQMDGVIRPNIIEVEINCQLPPLRNCALWATDSPHPALQGFIRRAKNINVRCCSRRKS